MAWGAWKLGKLKKNGTDIETGATWDIETLQHSAVIGLKSDKKNSKLPPNAPYDRGKVNLLSSVPS